ncbi:MAG: ABC transporter ATP-binding protein [Oscillospiraceae bacterium]|nr:ABC transporter ATP-binding protein [Oscillospiraceae bacterium]
MIELKDFRAGYKGVEKIRVDELRIEPGRILGLLGRNGSGKSTFLKALVGIIPYGGHAILDKTETSSMTHRERARRIAYLPQQLSPVSMSVGTLVAHGRFARMSFSKIMGVKDREAVRHALKMSGLWEERHRSVAELSGGERQRAYLAMVLAQETEYLLLDEPAASLDIAHQIEIMELLKQLSSDGRGIVITSHDLPQSAAYCDRICVIDRGRAALAIPAAELAEKTEMLRETLGVTLTPAGKGLYPYVLDR